MDLTLVPICNDQDHIVDNKYRITDHYCSICHREGINYQCINCDYSRCETCHKGVMRSIRDKHYEKIIKLSMHDSLHKALLKEQSKLNKDGLTEWSVKISRKDKELYYYNNRTRTTSFDYPKVFNAPELSPELSLIPVLSSKRTNNLVKETSEEELSITGHAYKVFQDMKDKMSNLNIY